VEIFSLNQLVAEATPKEKSSSGRRGRVRRVGAKN